MVPLRVLVLLCILATSVAKNCRYSIGINETVTLVSHMFPTFQVDAYAKPLKIGDAVEIINCKGPPRCPELDKECEIFYQVKEPYLSHYRPSYRVNTLYDVWFHTISSARTS
jgi:hypothetical protein